MIRPIDIRLNAAHPDYPLAEAVTFTGSPSTVLVRGVPPNCGRWAITAVSVAASYPDGSTTTRAAVQSANGVWVATLPATATSGRTANGIRVMANGIDENGEAVTGYVLGVADFAVASLDVTPAPQPGETSYQMLYFDAVPGVLRKGDVTKIDGVLKFYNGTAWEPFAAPPTLDDAVTRASANGVKSSGIWSALWGTASTAFSSLYDWCVAQLAGKATKADATLTEKYGDEWRISANKGPNGGALEVVYGVYISPTTWTLVEDGSSSRWHATGNPPADATSLSFNMDGTPVVATRFIGYQLGSQTDKPLASEAEAEALRTAVAGKMPSTATGADIAVSGSDATKISAALADKLAKSGGTMTGGLTMGGGNLITFSDSSGTRTMTIGLNGDSFEIKLYSYGTLVYTWRTPYNGGVFALASDLLSKLDASSASAPFSDDSSVSYPVGSHCTYNGKLYKCTTATTGGTWVAGSWEADMASNYFQYALVTKTIDNGAVTLDDRAINAVAVSSSLASLTVNFPTATSGKARDFGLRLTVASGITTAPQIVLPQGVVCENADGEAPEIGADGAATILYFTETASGVFLVKGEVLTAITQA